MLIANQITLRKSAFMKVKYVMKPESEFNLNSISSCLYCAKEMARQREEHQNSVTLHTDIIVLSSLNTLSD